MTRVVAVAVIEHARVLAARRAHPSATAGGWELPGGKCLAGETTAETAVREIREELGCSIDVVAELEGRSRISDELELEVVVARIASGEPVPAEHDMVRWLAPEEIRDVDWLPSDRRFLPKLWALLLEGERLVGGNVGGAVRIGPTVRRAMGSWSPAVHALLHDLATQELPHVPRLLGVDVSGREVLTFVPGRVIDVDGEVPSTSALTDAMRWLRRYHDAVAGFRHDGPWRTSDRPLQPGEIICHHDFAPYNVALAGPDPSERVVGVFDWDMAGPGTPQQELGFAAWNWVPLFRVLPADEVAERLRLMAAGYGGGVSPREILAAVVPRIERSIRVIRAGQQSGDPGMLNLAAVGEPERTARALADLRARLPALAAALHP